jgi:DNA invertase Pin-like site-specific DNA recombinase
MNPYIYTSPNSEKPRTPIAYGYARVSHVNSLEKGESLPAQSERITAYYDSALKPLGIDWGGVYDDGTNISAFRVPFHARPAGRKLVEILKPGDHLVLDKVDRIWRSIDDFVYIMQRFKEKNINIHIVNFLGATIQNNTPMGDFILRQFVLIAELESTIKSERIREALARKRNAGGKANYQVPAGCKIEFRMVNGREERFLVWCEKTRHFMDYLVRLIDDKGLQWKQTTNRVMDRYTKLNLRQVCADYSDNKEAFLRSLRRMYLYEVAYRYLGITDPAQIPSREIIFQAARQHRRQRTNERIKKNPRRYSIKKSTIPALTPDQLLSLA